MVRETTEVYRKGNTEENGDTCSDRHTGGGMKEPTTCVTIEMTRKGDVKRGI